MYKDTSSDLTDIDEDFQLVVEVGHIASHIRYLEQRYPSCFAVFDDLEDSETEDQQLDHEKTESGGGQTSLGTVVEVCGKTAESSSGSGNRKEPCGCSCAVCDSDSHHHHHHHYHHHRQYHYRSRKTSADIKRRRFVEDLLIRIYEEHKRIKDSKSAGSERFRMSQTKPGTQNADEELIGETILSTTTTTTTATSSSPLNTPVIQTPSSGTQPSQINSQRVGESDVRVDESSAGGIVKSACERQNCVGEVSSQVTASELKSVAGVGDASRSLVSTSNNLTATVDTSGGVVSTSAGGCSVSSVLATVSASHLNKLATAFKLCDEDLRSIVKDLRRKVEYSEKMNWMCISRRPMTPPHRKNSLPKHMEVKKRFLEICDNTLPDEIKAALRLPAFDSYEWDDADVIHLMQTMFMELGLIHKFNIPIETLREWLYEVYKHYNEVPFHNFRHCFCVAQMMYAISQQACLIQRLGALEVLILLVSCICHDLDHPGYNNIYQINARTELALRYNDISPLENHHCSIAFRVLEHPDCNIFKNFNRETFNVIREGIIRCILATDMARHNEILTQFKDVVPVFDYSNRSHVNLLCMVLIKVADISNEARPMDVAEPWLDRLLQEFFAQSAAEKSEGLPVTPFMDPDKVSKPGSQVRFIGLVLLPLFEALGDLLPDLTELIIIPVRVAFDYYKKLNDAQTRSRKSLADATENSSDGGGSPSLPRSQSGISVRSRRSIPSQKSASRTSVDEPTCLAAELHDLPEGSESGDSETATEVDVAEKTSKFKVDTECCNRSKSSRKPSREKRPSMISEMCSSGGGRIRNSYGNIHGYHSNRCHFGSNRAVSLDQYSTTNNRRLSDGLQQVISDSNVFYNRHNRNSDNEGVMQGGVPGHGSIINHGHMLGTDKTKMPEGSALMSVSNGGGGGNGVGCGDDTLNMNLANALYDNSCRKNRQEFAATAANNKSGTNSSNSGNGSCSQNGTAKSWRQRFRQITEMFSFGFDKSSKRFTSASVRSSPCSIRNNNATATDLQKPGICCTISNNMSPSLLKRNPDLINSGSGRNRAYSLDVPTRNRYSSSSGGGDSRKSSRNEDNSVNRHDPFAEDNNSNHTSSGGGDYSLAPPHIRIGSDSTEPIARLVMASSGTGCDVSIAGSITDSRPKI